MIPKILHAGPQRRPKHKEQEAQEAQGKLKGEGIYVCQCLIHVEVWQKQQVCKAIILQLKINTFYKKEKKV